MTLEEMYRSVCAYPGRPGFYTSDKGADHDYIKSYYEKEFEGKRDSVKNVLELGVQWGGSLMLWSEWFPNAKVVGLDIYEKVLEHYAEMRGAREYPNVEIRIQDGYVNPVIAEHPDSHYDYIIDDGPHSIESMIVAIHKWLPKVKPGGKLVIEDIQNYDWFEKLEKEVSPELATEFRRFDFRKNKNRSDDMIFEITRKDGAQEAK
jgi:cyclopropane fatty-acyl-phospholipid synthase-like methyltransferase